mmetsp:Transcript_69220/g.214731  ORF Transcript_69220/g.214731 Transcript_69220/m.214731 type:complete len:201 (-) Transcript_69220:1401-2003(-)
MIPWCSTTSRPRWTPCARRAGPTASSWTWSPSRTRRSSTRSGGRGPWRWQIPGSRSCMASSLLPATPRASGSCRGISCPQRRRRARSWLVSTRCAAATPSAWRSLTAYSLTTAAHHTPGPSRPGGESSSSSRWSARPSSSVMWTGSGGGRRRQRRQRRRPPRRSWRPAATPCRTVRRSSSGGGATRTRGVMAIGRATTRT